MKKLSLGLLFLLAFAVAHAQYVVKQTFTTTGSFKAPAGITSITVEAWGAGSGGSGGGNGGAGVGSGGGGGAYSKGVISVIPGISYSYLVGTGGVGGTQSGSGGSPGSSGGQTYFIDASTVLAQGGAPGNPGTGGLASAGVGTVKFSGGSGGLGSSGGGTGGGGGGGSSAGILSDGAIGLSASSAIGAAGGTAPTGGGNGGKGGDSAIPNNASSGSTPGGGGGGGGNNGGGSGGNGANGQITISYTHPGFITTWVTTDGTIKIPTNGIGYNYDVVWTNVTNPGVGEGSAYSQTGSYAITGLQNGSTYRLFISGLFPRIDFSFDSYSQINKIRTIDQWGNIAWTSFQNAFNSCFSLTYSATDAPDLTNVTSLNQMFLSATSFNGNLSNWNTSTITDMAGTFYGASSFNGNISTWNTANVTAMNSMFDYCTAFNSDISAWDVSKVTTMGYMFEGATSFNGNIGGWNTNSVVIMNDMFIGATAFNQNLGGWNISNIINGGMGNMLNNSGLSTNNYDATLAGWAAQTVPSGITLGASGLTYCNAVARNKLTAAPNNWIISDAGQNAGCPVVLDVSSSATDGTYGIGSVIPVNVTFNKAVNVVGTPTITLETGATDRVVNYTSGSGSAILTFNYTVQSGDTSPDLDYIAWTLTAGTSIKDATPPNLNASLTLPTPGAAKSLGSNKNIVINTAPSTGFITTWKTDNPGTSATNQITIPTNGCCYNYSVDWGDGQTNSGITGDITHTYASAGTYTVSITGAFPTIYFNNAGDKAKILSIEQWGDIAWKDMSNSFWGCSNLINNATDAPDLTNVTSLFRTFTDASSFNGDLSNWDVSTITTMYYLFQGTSFNGDITTWDVSNVQTMIAMFTSNTSFNQDISGWDVSAATAMESMFHGASAFNQDLSAWDVSNVSNMNFMFFNATSFNQSLGSWDISSLPPGGSNMLSNAGLSDANYDATLIGWANLGVGETKIPTGVTLGADGLSYCLSASDRTKLINTYGWTINGDTSCPLVTSVSSSTADGPYGIGAVVSVTVLFNKVVNVVGIPTITLETGTTDRVVNYSSGTGTNTLTFDYTVQAGDISSDLDYLNATALALNAGTIKDAANNDAILTLPAPGAANSLGATKAIIIDGVVPAAPSIPDLDTADDIGLSTTDNITSNDASLTLTGTAEAGALITFTESGLGILGTATATSGAYTFDFDIGSGTYTITATAQDAAGNNSIASGSLTLTVDTGNPTVTLNQSVGQADPASTVPVSFDVVFNKAIDPTTFTSADITLGGTAAVQSVTSLTSPSLDNINWVLTVTATGAGTIIPSIAVGILQDVAGNTNTASISTDNTVTFSPDTTPPTVTIASIVASPTNVSTIPVTFTFSESVTGFLLTDISVTNGTASGFSGSGTTYTANITPTAAGAVTISVAANAATDAAANGNTISNTLSITYDNVLPTVVISSAAASPTNVSPIPVTITFSESVTGFLLTDITVANGTASGFSGSGATYTANITPTTAGAVTISVAANAATDAAANGNTISNTLSITYDNVVPTVVISSAASSPTGVSPIPVTITFSESVTGFLLTDITVTNGTASGFSGSGTTYTANITPTAAGAVTISVAANAATDAAANGNTISNTLSITYDNVVPTVVVSSTASSPTNISPIPVTITFSESVTGFLVTDISVTNGTASGFSGSGTTYTANITPTTAGAVTISVAANTATDAAANGNTVSNTLSITYDNVVPTVVVSSAASSPTNISPIPVTITFSESVTGFLVTDITVTNGTASGFSGSGTTYTANITPTAAGAVTISVAANAATDAAANGNTISNTLSITYDNVVPTVIVSSAASSPTGVSPIPVTITFSESVTGFLVTDISVTNGTASGFSGSGTTYTANITPTTAGAVTISVAANAATDAATNGNTVSNTLSITYDNVVPTVIVSSAASSPTGVSPIPVTITFSESVTGFLVTDISVTNGTASGFSGSGTTYTANITPTTAGAVTISVAANAATDAAANGNTISNTLSITYDNVVPTVVVSSAASNPTGVSPIPVTITFSEGVTGFLVTDISVTNGTASAFSGSGTTYTANITPTAAGAVTISVAANAAADAAANGNALSNTLSITYDNVSPTVSITSTASEPTGVSPIPVTITFSESVTGFIVSDITVTNGTAGNFVGSGTTYTADITPAGAGIVTVSVVANVASDAAANGNTASNTLSRTYNNTAPTATITSTATEPTNVSPIPVTITFSESVTGFALTDITVTNGTAGNFAGSGSTYTATVTPTAAGAVTVSVLANAAVSGTAIGNTASNVLSRTYDNVGPTAVISSTASNPTNVSPIPVTITFSESVTGFLLTDITVTNGTAGSFAGSGTTYTANITPTAAGAVTISVAANAAADLATNGNTASNTLSSTFDNIAPTVTITSTSTDPTGTSPIPVTITFSESVTGFIVSDITVTNGTAGSFAGSGTTYTANIIPTAAGAVTVSVAANVAADAATNGNTISNTLSRTYNNTAPSVTITSLATDPTNVSPIPVTITFSEIVTGFIVSDITVTNGTAGSFAGSGTTYTASITPTAAGAITISVAANVAVNATTIGNTISNTLSRTFDNISPTVTITSTSTDPTGTSPIPVTITFSEVVTGFIVGDITVTNGTASGFSGSGTTYSANVTPAALGAVTVNVAANVAADAATNGNTASNTLTRTYNNLSKSSDMVLNGFTPPSNITYENFQEATNIQNSGTSIEVVQFDIRDGGAAGDTDAATTTLTALTLDLGANFNLINRIALYESSSEISEQVVSGQTVSFTGLSFSTPDDGTKTIIVRVSFKATVTDNQQFSIAISSATASASGSTFAAANAGGAVSSTTGNSNRIEVTATKLSFTVQPANTAVNVAMTPAVVVEARDALNNKDLDFTSSIGLTSTGTLAAAQNATAVAGVGTFSNIIHSAAGTGLTLSTNSTGLSNGTSNPFNITTVATAPVITAVGIPNVSMKIGDVVTATITVNSSTETFTLPTGSTIGGFVISNLAKTNSTTYTAQFTITSGGTDVAAGSNIPVNLILSGSAGNSTAFTTAIAQSTDPIDANVPVVTAVSSSTANGSYSTGSVIALAVSFNEVVLVTGTPQITLETGTTDRVVNYTSGSGTSTLTFNYTVQSGDVSADLDYTSSSALALNSGTIKDAAANNATLTLASPGATGSLGFNKAIVITFNTDIIPPTVLSINYQTPATSPTNATSVTFRVVFSEPVLNVDAADFTKILSSSGVTAGTVSVATVNSTTFDVSVASVIGSGTIRLDVLNTASITDAGGNAYASDFTTGQVYTIDNTAPIFSTTAPASNSTVNNPQVSFTLSETLSTGTITWTRTGGTADGNSPHAQALVGGELTSGPHASITLTNSPTLVAGAIYSVSFTGVDLAGNSSTPVTETNITFTPLAATLSDIVASSSFSYPQNIDYVSFQEASDIQNSSTSLPVAKFDIRDGGASGNDTDPFPTILTGMTIDLGSNFSLIRRIALYNGAGDSELAGTDKDVTSQKISFSNLSISSDDNASTSFTIRVSFVQKVTDNQQFSFTITAASAQASNSTFASSNAGGAASSTANNNNRLEVIASALDFVQQPSNTIVNEVMTPAVTVQAIDANGNLDLDFSGTVNLTSQGSMSSTPVVSMASGLGTSSTITFSEAATGLTLTTTNNFSVANATSEAFDIYGDTEGIELIINSFITPNTADDQNNVLYIENIEFFPENTVKLIDRWGVHIKSWTNFSNYSSSDAEQADFDFTSLSIGNYVCIVEYKNATGGKKSQTQMISVLK